MKRKFLKIACTPQKQSSNLLKKNKIYRRKNRDAAELMGAIDSVLSMLPKEEKSSFTETEELKTFRKHIESIRKIQ